MVDTSVGISEHHKSAEQSLLPSPWLEMSPQNLKFCPNKVKTMSLEDLKKDDTGWVP